MEQRCVKLFFLFSLRDFTSYLIFPSILYILSFYNLHRMQQHIRLIFSMHFTLFTIFYDELHLFLWFLRNISKVVIALVYYNINKRSLTLHVWWHSFIRFIHKHRTDVSKDLPVLWVAWLENLNALSADMDDVAGNQKEEIQLMKKYVENEYKKMWFF